MVTPLRLMVYDATCTGTLVGLTHVWRTGGLLYGGLGRLDAWRGVRSWAEAFEWLASHQPDRPIGEVQYWGHGKWGRALVATEVLDRSALRPGHGLHAPLARVRERTTAGSQWWFRTCDTFGASVGHDFARAWTEFFGCPAAGHTYVIAAFQSGLHRLRPGDAPHWPAAEGIAEGTPDRPVRSTWSGPLRPHTITCLHGAVPEGW